MNTRSSTAGRFLTVFLVLWVSPTVTHAFMGRYTFLFQRHPCRSVQNRCAEYFIDKDRFRLNGQDKDGGYSFTEGDQYDSILDEVNALGGDSWFLEGDNDDKTQTGNSNGSDGGLHDGLTEAEVLSVGGDPFFLCTDDDNDDNNDAEFGATEQEFAASSMLEEVQARIESKAESRMKKTLNADEPLQQDDQAADEPPQLDATSIFSMIGGMGGIEGGGGDLGMLGIDPPPFDGKKEPERLSPPSIPNTAAAAAAAEIAEIEEAGGDPFFLMSETEDAPASSSPPSSSQPWEMESRDEMLDEIEAMGGDPFFFTGDDTRSEGVSGLPNDDGGNTNSSSSAIDSRTTNNDSPALDPELQQHPSRQPLNAVSILASLPTDLAAASDGMGTDKSAQVMLGTSSDATIKTTTNNLGGDDNTNDQDASDGDEREVWEWDGIIDEDAHMGFD